MFTSKQRQVFGLLVALVAIFTVFFGTTVIKAQEPATVVEITGAIQAMDTQSITINGQLIQITAAEIKTSLELNKVVKVQGLFQSGQIIAREVSLPSADDDSPLPGEVEIVGLLSAYDGTSMLVGAFQINVATAQIQAGIQVGNIVKVHASLSATGEWIAREVEAELGSVTSDDNSNDDNSNDNSADDNGNDDNSNDNSVNFTSGEFEIVGTLDALSGDSATVAGLTFSLTGAEIKGTLIIGITVKVHASMVNGIVVAREIESYVPGQDDNGNDDNGNDDNGNDDNGNDDSSNDNAVVIPADCVAAQPAGWTTYTIRSGDTFSAIAEGASISMGELARVNCIADPRFIVAGVTIFVPQTPVMDDNSSNDNNGSDDNGNDDNGNDDNGNDDNGNDDNGNDDNGNDDNGNDDNGGHGSDDDDDSNDNDD